MKPMMEPHLSLELRTSERWQEAPPLRICTVTSGKGGVGKSNIAANLGLTLARLRRQVLLIDADLGLANLDILLGLAPRYSIQDVLARRRTLAETLVRGPDGIEILPASSGIPELADLSPSEKVFLLNELDHYSENLDVVLIDTGAGISPNVLFFNMAALERIVVVNREPTSITDACALMKVLVTRHGARRFKLLANGLSTGAEAHKVFCTLLQVAERHLGEVSLDYLGWIPHDEAIPQAVLQQKALLDLFPKAKASKSFLDLAQKLWESPPPPDCYGNIQFFWRRLLRS
jgi:flagellar biosynthesis protein FlhG